MREHLGFGNTANSELRFTASGELNLIGEHNSDNKLHGRGILICSKPDNDDIFIGYWAYGLYAPGNYVYIQSDVEVGEIYLKNDSKDNKWIEYNPDGTLKIWN